MNYSDTVQWLFSKLPMYQNQGKSAYKKDLTNTVQLAKHLGHPENQFKSIHVAGTNGKGSTCHILASILQESGYKVGLYTSPHLKDYTERIKINGQAIPEEFVVDFVKTNKQFLEYKGLSFFEMTVGLAFLFFAKKKVDIAIIETGLGGRLDSTNIITPIVSVITNIGLDHMSMLGDTHEKIAFEKAGIIKKGIPVALGEVRDDTIAVFQDKAKQMDTTLYFANQLPKTDYLTDLKGTYQNENIRTALMTIEIIKSSYPKISDESIASGLRRVISNTGLMGRWQILNNAPKIICDTAHNREGLEMVLTQIQQQDYKELHLVLGFVNDKDLDTIIDLFPVEAHYYFCEAKVQRAMEVQKLSTLFCESGRKGHAYSTVSDALSTAKDNADKKDLIFVGGSTFVVAEVV